MPSHPDRAARDSVRTGEWMGQEPPVAVLSPVLLNTTLRPFDSGTAAAGRGVAHP